jgi:hypothetical protein
VWPLRQKTTAKLNSGRMSAWGHFRPFQHGFAMSGYPPEAEIGTTGVYEYTLSRAQHGWAKRYPGLLCICHSTRISACSAGYRCQPLLICPTVQPSYQKFFAFPFGRNTSTRSTHPTPQRGVSRSSRTRGGMRWTWAARRRTRPPRGRRSRMVLTPRRWRQVGGSVSAGDGGNKARLTGESTKETVKTIACGNAG